MKKKKIRKLIACTILMMTFFLVSCSKNIVQDKSDLGVVKLNEEIKEAVSTLTWRDDTFTFPCSTKNFIEAGYDQWSLSQNYVFDPEDSSSTQYKVINNYWKGNYIIDNDGGRFSICVANNEEKIKKLSECMAFAVEILINEDDGDWSYMGLTSASSPEDVTAAFSGIFEFKIREGNGNIRLTYEDRDRLISFYWKNGSDNGITQLILEMYPDGEYRECCCEIGNGYIVPEAD